MPYPGDRIQRAPDQAHQRLASARRPAGQHHHRQAVAKLGDLDFVCLLVGGEPARGGSRSELEGLIKRYDLGHRCVILDHCDDMPAAYKVANVVVYASTEPPCLRRATGSGS